MGKNLFANIIIAAATLLPLGLAAQNPSYNSVVPKMKNTAGTIAINQDILTNAQSKTAFIGRTLSIDPNRFGLASPVSLDTGHGQLLVPGKASVSLVGHVWYTPVGGVLKVGENTMVELKLYPPPMEQNAKFLVSVTLDNRGPNSIEARYASSGGYMVQSITQRPEIRSSTFNFIVEKQQDYRGEGSPYRLTLQKYSGDWQLDSIEITPITLR